jgi:hypothetical protein
VTWVHRSIALVLFFWGLIALQKISANSCSLRCSVRGGLALGFGPAGRWATAGTLASVLGGLSLVCFRGRKFRIPWTKLRLTVLDRIVLFGFFVSYLAIVAESMLVSHRDGEHSDGRQKQKAHREYDRERQHHPHKSI